MRILTVTQKVYQLTHPFSKIDSSITSPRILTVGKRLEVWFEKNLPLCCGVGRLNSGSDDPLLPACIKHDGYFVAHHNGDNSKTLDEVNAIFWKQAMAIAAFQPTRWQRMRVRTRAIIWYQLILIFGKDIWDNNYNQYDITK